MSVYDLLTKWGEEQGMKADVLFHHLQKLELEDKIVPKLYSKDMDSDGKVREIFDVQSIAVRNVKGVEARELTIAPGITMIYGPNDAGKSTFLDGIELAMIGARGEAVPALMRAGATEMEVMLKATACEVNRLYRRKVAQRGKKAGEVTYEHELIVTIDGTKDNKTEKAQALLASWSVVDLQFVIRCSMVRQGHLAAVLDEAASTRQELFFRLLALDAAEETRAAIAKVAKDQAAKASANESVIKPAQAEIDKLNRDLAQMPPVDQMRGKLFALEAMAAPASSRVDKEARLSLVKRAIANFEKWKELHAKYVARVAELNKSPALFLEVVDFAPKLAQAESATRHHVAGVGKREQLVDVIKELGSAIKRDGVCATCGTICGQATKDASLIRLKTAHGAAVAELERAKEAREEADKLFTYALSERVRMTQVAAEKTAIQAQVATIYTVQQELELLIAGFDEKSARQDQAELERAIATEAGDPKIVEEIADWRRYIQNYENVNARINALKIQIDSAKNVIANRYDPEVLEQLELAFSKRGMPLWIARQHIARVNAIAAEIAAGDRYRYELGPDLEVSVIDGDITVSPRTASGSSRQRGALVILCALALYLQELASIRVPFLWIDEVPFQDQANQALLVEMLRNIAKRVPKVVFGASDWESYQGKFDHEVGVLPPKRIAPPAAAIAPAPTVKLHSVPLSTITTPAMDKPDQMAAAAAPALPTFDELQARLAAPRPAAAARVDPLTLEIPHTPSLVEDDDPF